MNEVTVPGIAITLVLDGLFIPTCSSPGITGQLYRHLFALHRVDHTAFISERDHVSNALSRPCDPFLRTATSDGTS